MPSGVAGHCSRIICHLKVNLKIPNRKLSTDLNFETGIRQAMGQAIPTIPRDFATLTWGITTMV
jgi:hypothetical protein